MRSIVRTLRARARVEAGLSLVEILVGMTVLGVGLTALVASTGLGFRQVNLGRQRQSAAEIANARLEHLRNVPYDRIAVRQPGDAGEPALQHQPNADNPDHHVVDGSPLRLHYKGGTTSEDLEDLIVSAQGDIDHIEDPVAVGATTMEIYQYATWVDDADIPGTQNYKRVTIVVKYKVPAITGVTKFVRASSLFTPGTVSSGGTQASPNPGQQASPSPSPSSSPASCSGDTTAPGGSFSIASATGADPGFTPTTTVSLSMSFSDDCTPIKAKFSNDGSTYGDDVTYDAANPTVSWTLPAGDGTKTVHGKVRDGANNERALDSRDVVLDTTKPTVPGTLSRTVSCSGEDRTVTLSYGTSSDTNFSGYRIYRSIDSGAWTALGTTSSTSYQDTHKKTYDSVRFRVVGYDKAGNESDATNTISLARNECS